MIYGTQMMPKSSVDNWVLMWITLELQVLLFNNGKLSLTQLQGTLPSLQYIFLVQMHILVKDVDQYYWIMLLAQAQRPPCSSVPMMITQQTVVTMRMLE